MTSLMIVVGIIVLLGVILGILWKRNPWVFKEEFFEKHLKITSFIEEAKKRPIACLMEETLSKVCFNDGTEVMLIAKWDSRLGTTQIYSDLHQGETGTFYFQRIIKTKTIMGHLFKRESLRLLPYEDSEIGDPVVGVRWDFLRDISWVYRLERQIFIKENQADYCLEEMKRIEEEAGKETDEEVNRILNQGKVS